MSASNRSHIVDKLRGRIYRATTFHRQGAQPNIFIFSAARSGSTWLMELLATQGKFKLVNEPFNLRKPWISENLGINQWQDLFLPENKPLIRSYIQSFVSGRDTDSRFKREKPLSAYWHLRTDRIIFKILFAGEDDIDWYRREFGGQIILLIRHPIPVSLSRMELPRLPSFTIPPYSEQFSQDQIAYAKKVESSKSHLQKAVLDWCFQYAVPLRSIHPEWIVLPYEQLVVQPMLVIEHLVRKLELPNASRMHSQIFKASRSTEKSSSESQSVLRDEAELRDKRYWLINKWRDKVSRQQEEDALETLEVFDIDFYQCGQPMPAERYLISP